MNLWQIAFYIFVDMQQLSVIITMGRSFFPAFVFVCVCVCSFLSLSI